MFARAQPKQPSSAASASARPRRLGRTDDPAEREADRMADEALGRRPSDAPAAPPLMPPGASASAADLPAGVADVLGSPGVPLPVATRADLGARFGVDFGRVRIHADDAAAVSAGALGARAYAVGRHVAFGRGHYAPGTARGDRLLAHELAHVAQSAGGAPALLRRAPEDVPELDRRLAAALAAGDFAEAARALNSFSEEDIDRRLATMKRGQAAAIHQAALDAPELGPESNAAKRSHGAWLVLNYANAVKAGNWPRAAELLNGFSDADIAQRVGALGVDQQRAMRAAAPAWAARVIAPLEAALRVIRPDRPAPPGEEGGVALEEVPADQAAALKQRGVDLPTASAAALDPRGHADFIERRCTGVGFGIYLGGYLLFCDGVDAPLLLPHAHIDQAAGSAAPLGGVIHPSRDAALAAVAKAPAAAGQPAPFAYYRAARGLIVPTIFSPASTPRLAAEMAEVTRRLGKEVSDELTVMAITMVGGKAIQLAVRGLVRLGAWAFDKALKMPPPRLSGAKGPRLSTGVKAGGTGDPAPVKPPPAPAPSGTGGGGSAAGTASGPVPPQPAPAQGVATAAASSGPKQQAAQLVQGLQAKGEKVVVNIGGTGASHEPQTAINLNNQAVKRKTINRLVEADGTDIGDVFAPDSVDRIEGHNMAPGVIDWSKAGPGSFRVLRSGGVFNYYYRGGNKDAAVLAQALRDAGFEEVVVVGDAWVRAKKP